MATGRGDLAGQIGRRYGAACHRVRRTDLKAFSVGERFPAYADPNNPDMLRPATGGALWGGVGMLAFFTLALAGAGLFLLRSGSPPRK
jgi:hypothetical protein